MMLSLPGAAVFVVCRHETQHDNCVWLHVYAQNGTHVCSHMPVSCMRACSGVCVCVCLSALTSSPCGRGLGVLFRIANVMTLDRAASSPVKYLHVDTRHSHEDKN